MKRLLLITALLAVVACSETDEADLPDISGTWYHTRTISSAFGAEESVPDPDDRIVLRLNQDSTFVIEKYVDDFLTRTEGEYSFIESDLRYILLKETVAINTCSSNEEWLRWDGQTIVASAMPCDGPAFVFERTR